MANLKNVIYLSNEDYETLVSTGTVIIEGETLIYDENNVYVTPDKLASSTEDGLMSAADKTKLDSIQSGTKLYKHSIKINTDNTLIIHSTREKPYTALTDDDGSVGDDLAKGNCYFVSGTYDKANSELIASLISNGVLGFYFDKYNWEHNSRLDPVYASNSMFVSDTVTQL